MKKEDCIFVDWKKIPSDELMDMYCRENSCDYLHKRILTAFRDSNNSGFRAFVQDSFESILKRNEIVKLGYFRDYLVECPAFRFIFKNEPIEIIINTQAIEDYLHNTDECWSYWSSFFDKDGRIYHVEIFEEYVDGEIVIGDKIDVIIHSHETNDVIMITEAKKITID